MCKYQLIRVERISTGNFKFIFTQIPMNTFFLIINLDIIGITENFEYFLDFLHIESSFLFLIIRGREEQNNWKGVKTMNDLTNVTTGEVRLSYVHLFKPYAFQPGQ